jgi:hypothetical protein
MILYKSASNTRNSGEHWFWVGSRNQSPYWNSFALMQWAIRNSQLPCKETPLNRSYRSSLKLKRYYKFASSNERKDATRFWPLRHRRHIWQLDELIMVVMCLVDPPSYNLSLLWGIMSDFQSSAIVSNLTAWPGKCRCLHPVRIARMALSARVGLSPRIYVLHII